MKIEETVDSLKKADKTSLVYLYNHFRNNFVKWMVTANDCPQSKALEIYRYAILSFYESLLLNKDETYSENDIRVYLYSIGKNKWLSRENKSTGLSNQAEIEKELHDSSDNKQHFQPNQIKNIYEKLGHPCKEVLESIFFYSLDDQQTAKLIDYKNDHNFKGLKHKCIDRFHKQLILGDD